MGNSFTIGTVLKDHFWSIFSDFTCVTYIILSLIVLSLFSLLLTILYKKIRRKFPVKVNCWFCNNNTTVPFDLFNCWDCPHCNQYNGFDKDGGYNKIIPQQYDHKLNDTTFTTLKGNANSDSLQLNGFCKLCNINQQLKIQQLALFMPLDENNYYNELDQYREKLERAYKLCSKCEKTLQETLEKQEYNILTNRLNNHKFTSSAQMQVDQFNRKNILALIRKSVESGLKVICVAVAILLLLALLNHFETENELLNLSLPDFVITEPLIFTLKVLLSYADKIYNLKRELSFAGLLCWFLADLDNQIRKTRVCLITWVLLHCLLWTTFTGPQVLFSGICLYLTVQASRSRFIYFCKNPLPKKLGFQPVKKIFPEAHNTSAENHLPRSMAFSPSLKSDNFASRNAYTNLAESKFPEAEQKLIGRSDSPKKRKKLRKKENEVESLPNEEKEKSEPKIWNVTPNPCSPASFEETDKNTGETNGPFSEVYSTLNNLHIGQKKKKSSKPPNFLFSNHNFSELKSSSSIIKPARLIKNLSSTSWTDSNEGNSRSSTPSSGYSSQKPEKPEPGRYDFQKTSTPLLLNSFTRHTPSNYFDHYDGNHLFYNNMNCFSPGFVPFQQYPGAMGHTTIYACTRPTNFPFPFTPCQGFPGQKFSPGSSRFSDTSESHNLFQDSSKSFEKYRRWRKIKSFLYYLSILLNIATVMGLFLFISTGVVLVDWKLPKFDFFV